MFKSAENFAGNKDGKLLVLKLRMKKNKLRVVELFAGVGGFRLGLEGWKGNSASSHYKKKLVSNFEVVWSNQWEPSSARSGTTNGYNLVTASRNRLTRGGSYGFFNCDLCRWVMRRFDLSNFAALRFLILSTWP